MLMTTLTIYKPMVELNKLIPIPLVHSRCFSDASPMDDLKDLIPMDGLKNLIPMDDLKNLIPMDDLKNLIPPASVSALGTEEIVSLEAMLSRRVLVFDFDTAWVKLKGQRLTKPGRLSGVERALLDYEGIFKDLLEDSNSKNTCLKLKFCLVRLRLDTFLVELLLRDYLKRFKLHLNLLSELHEMDGTNGSTKAMYYMKQSDLLLKELDDFFARKVEVFGHVDNAFSSYRVDSKCDFGMYVLEKDFYKLRASKEDRYAQASLWGILSLRLPLSAVEKVLCQLILSMDSFHPGYVAAHAFGVLPYLPR